LVHCNLIIVAFRTVRSEWDLSRGEGGTGAAVYGAPKWYLFGVIIWITDIGNSD